MLTLHETETRLYQFSQTQKISMRFQIFTAMKFRGPCSKVLKNTGILPHYYMASQLRRPGHGQKIFKSHKIQI